jgi:cytochrome c biogenesis protein CcdA
LRASATLPGGAHEAASNEADAVDVTQHELHKLRHEFLHHPLSFFLAFVFVFVFGQLLFTYFTSTSNSYWRALHG